LGLGITALIAGFMSGMAGNVSAFTTVWTYDSYRALIKRDGTDRHYVAMGRWATVIGVAISIGTAYLVMDLKSIMDYVQALFSFFIAPMFATVLLGMLWKRATPAGGFCGLLAGTASSVGMWAWVKVDPTALRYVALSPYARDMAENMYRALWSCLTCALVTVLVSLVTKPKPQEELKGLVYGATEIPSESYVTVLHRPWFWAVVVGVAFVLVNIILLVRCYETWRFDLHLVLGLSLLVNGALILGAGLYELWVPPVHPVVLGHLHAPIWWGALLAVTGAIYLTFPPSLAKRQ
jgi:solute:Na+ symporter, SSS family